MAFMSHKFLPIVRIIEMEIPPANVLLFIETRNDFVSQIPTFYFILFLTRILLYSKSEIDRRWMMI